MHEVSLVTSGTGTGKTTYLANLATQTTLMGICLQVLCRLSRNRSGRL
jgi:predicted ATPase